MQVTILWLRNTLRIHDNPVLLEALRSQHNQVILPLFVLDSPRLHKENSTVRLRFLYESISDLNTSFKKYFGAPLNVLSGQPDNLFEAILASKDFSVTGIITGYSNKPYDIEQERLVRAVLEKNKIPLHIVAKVNTLTNIEKVVSDPNFKKPKSMKDMEKIFAKYYPKNSDGFFSIDEPLPKPSAQLKTSPVISKLISQYIFDLEQELETISDTTKSYFKGGETEALLRLAHKVTSEEEYVRKFSKPQTSSTNLPENPLEPHTTGLSSYLSFGCLSPRALWKACEKCYQNGEHTKPPVSLHGQMLFREMFHILSRSVANWDTDTNNSMCKKIRWDEADAEILSKWEKGETGFPYIDAMMRQLNVTGWMHHLGRHAVSCFLTRGQLWQHWKHGRDVFDKKLVDGDWALNNGNWLWLAGVAPFSMPYFRLYNPCPSAKSSLNAETKLATFVRHWVPELKDFPSKYIYEPHLAPISVQESAGCLIGRDYPMPIVDRKIAARENLAKFKMSLAELK